MAVANSILITVTCGRNGTGFCARYRVVLNESAGVLSHVCADTEAAAVSRALSMAVEDIRILQEGDDEHPAQPIWDRAVVRKGES